MKTYNFFLVDKSAPFQIDDFITALRPAQNHTHVNFSVVYMLREGTDIRYFYPSANNSCLLSTAFRVNEERNIDALKHNLRRGPGYILTPIKMYAQTRERVS